MEDKIFVNKVELTGILTVDLMDYAPTEEVLFFDIAKYLYMELILKEKEFKEALAKIDWNLYEGKLVAIGCSTDAIVPTWAYMTIANHLEGIAKDMDYLPVDALKLQVWKANIEQADFSSLIGKKVVIRANAQIDPSLYITVTAKTKTLVKSLMFGEAGMPKVIYKK